MVAVVISQVFERVRNLRDLGGRKTGDGRRVVPRRLYRSGSLHRATPGDRAALQALGIRVVIDLRSDWERRHDPAEMPGARCVSAPLVTDDVVSTITSRFVTGSISSEELEDWWNLTRVFQAPEEHLSSVRRIFDTLLETKPDEPILFHCRGGKDRTGMVSALILEGLGVTRDEIHDDFMASNPVGNDDRMAEQVAPIVSAMRGRPLTDAALFSLSGVRSEWLDTLFARIEGRFGSVNRYLADHVGIGSAGLERLRHRYLKEDGSEGGAPRHHHLVDGQQ